MASEKTDPQELKRRERRNMLLDKVLVKISVVGMISLTEKETEFLDRCARELRVELGWTIPPAKRP